MKCPYCGEASHKPRGRAVDIVVSFKGVDIIIIYCPHCEAFLGAVNKPKD